MFLYAYMFPNVCLLDLTHDSNFTRKPSPHIKPSPLPQSHTSRYKIIVQGYRKKITYQF